MLYDFSKTKEADLVREAARVGYNAFLNALDEYTRVEWIDGEAEFMSPVSLFHVRVNHFLQALIDRYLEVNPIGEVLGDGFQMRIGPKSGRVPDLCFLRTEHLDRLKPTYLDGPADLVVEIVSPESVKRDRVQKFREYAACGVPEYWIVDTIGGVSDFYLLRDGAFELSELDEHGRFHSIQLPGLRINPQWVHKDPLPSTKSVLVEAGISE